MTARGLRLTGSPPSAIVSVPPGFGGPPASEPPAAEPLPQAVSSRAPAAITVASRDLLLNISVLLLGFTAVQ
ncbi:hypothetical protein B0293_36940 [Amycolatopsis azurea DSM 43854]|uniref:Uncharacterized protein n=1 Tax=Amycolatopsis azurea DSM 43854 TaxID=1238180 RepID=M2QB53_9PSEU|nr:hypothetical protein C791_5015 [Amycolatopsis azurea DSM 43854]OOC01891.1 hypothetical protein B0293_36940 [Amycolatopsis azurea DSM 43854]